MSRSLPGNPRTSGRRRTSLRALRDTVAAYLFLSPSAIIIGVFGIFPVFFTLYVSVHRWRLAKGAFSGFANFAKLFGDRPFLLLAVAASVGAMVLASVLIRDRKSGVTAGLRLGAGLVLLAGAIVGLVVALPILASQGDKDVYDALRVTIWYSICTVPVQLAGGVLVAVLLTAAIRGKQAFRVIYLTPYIAPTVATAAIFELLFSLRPDSFSNQVLKIFGAGPLQWLQEPKGIFTLLFGSPAAPPTSVIPAYWAEWGQGPSLALTAIILYSWWVFIGYYALIYMNGLSAIPKQLYEAAEVDGASKLRSFFSITLPLLSPTTYFLSLLGVIGTFKAFTHLFVLRSTAASGTVDSISISIFFTAFRKGNMGYAAAVSVLLFVIVLGLTLLQQRTTEKGVTYGD
jgi:multiple sugar transport system permease protein